MYISLHLQVLFEIFRKKLYNSHAIYISASVNLNRRGNENKLPVFFAREQRYEPVRAKVEQQSTETLSFRCCCERYRLSRAGCYARRHTETKFIFA